MIRNRLTFRQVFFTMCILITTDIAVRAFTASTDKFGTTTGSGQSLEDDYYQMDARELGRDYQIEIQNNGDAVIWEGRRYVGTVPFYKHENCTLQQIIMGDND